jgi:hypothetical protein
LQYGTDQFISLVTHCFGKTVVAVRVLDHEVAFTAEQPIDRACSSGAAIYARPSKIVVTKWRVYEEGAWSQSSQQFVEVKGDFLQSAAIV